MKVIKATIPMLESRTLVIGFQAENQRTQVRIDCAPIFAEYPHATPSLAIKPPAGETYPVFVNRDGNEVVWTILSENLALVGDGELQLTFVKDSVIAKTIIGHIRILRSLVVDGETPDPVAQWIDDANAKLAEVDAVIVSIDEMDATAHGLSEGSAPTAEVQDVDDHKRIVLGIPVGATGATGAKGDKGDRGEVGATPQMGIGQVSTLPAGSSATASMSGTTENPLLNLGIPQGIQGVKGDRGEKGDTGATGATGATPDFSIGTVSTLPAGSSATAEITGTAENPVLSLGIPQGVQGIQGVQGVQGEKGEKGDPGEVTTEQMDAAIDEALQDYARIDGYYPDMTVGNAEQLNSSKFVENSEPYTLRPSGGTSDIGNREYLDAVVGGTVAWNQMVNYDSINSPITVAGITYSMTGNGKISANGTSTGETAFFLSPDGTNKGNTTYKKDHVYLLKGCPTGGAGTKYYLSWSLSGDDIGSGNVKKATADVGNGYVYIRVRTGVEVSNLVFVPQLFDLTQMFGSAVADYIYNLEQANAGAGVAYFRSWFPDDYYPYNAGELRHVEGLQSHDMVGFNLWDEEWELGGINTQGNNETATDRIRSKNYIRVFPNAYYYFKSSNTLGLRFYDANKKFITNQAVTNNTWKMPSDCYYLRFIVLNTISYKHDICINLSHNGSRNGEYEPYEKHSYPLDSTVVLRGIPKVGANGVYWDGDRYLPDGTVERRYGVVDLGTLPWNDNDNKCWLTNAIPGIKPAADPPYANRKQGVICAKYPADTQQSISGTAMTDKTWLRTGTSFAVKDTAYENVAAFKAAMSGVLLVYELATPTTETAQPYHSTQWVSDWGTEEFVSTGIVPVGTETRYPANLRDKLQHLPDAASGNGSYLITQTDGQMVLTPFPAPPSTAGNYVLKATVTNGVATYTWEVAT